VRLGLPAFIAAFFLAACVPFPNRRFFSPEVSGTVARNGMPVAGAEVVLSTRLSKAVATARTDAAGQFKLGPLSELQFTKSFFGDPIYGFTLKIKAAGEEERPGLAFQAMGYAPDTAHVACDLGLPLGQGKSARFCSIVSH